MGKSDFRNFSAFEENIDAALICKIKGIEKEWFDSGSFQLFAENRYFDGFGQIALRGNCKTRFESQIR